MGRGQDNPQTVLVGDIYHKVLLKCAVLLNEDRFPVVSGSAIVTVSAAHVPLDANPHSQ